MISPSLKKKVAVAIFFDIIQKNKRFNETFELKVKELAQLSSTFDKQLKGNDDLQEALKKKLVNTVVVKLIPQLYRPEDTVIQNFDETRDLYLISKGECRVIILDEQNNIDSNEKVLHSGAYFGEISLIYGCRRTCTVISRKYSTLAKLTRADYMEIITEMPEL